MQYQRCKVNYFYDVEAFKKIYCYCIVVIAWVVYATLEHKFWTSSQLVR